MEQESKTRVNPFNLVQQKIDEVAELLRLERNVTLVLRWPVREMNVHFTVKMDDSGIKMFHGYRVHYNDARGICKGGIRFHPDETLDQVRSAAAWMTWKTALIDIPLGGASGSVACNPKEMSRGEKQRMCRAYIDAIHTMIGSDKDIPAPDLYTTPLEMAWMLDEYEKINGRKDPAIITGKPVELQGSVGRIESSAMGGCFAVREAANQLGIPLKDASVAIQGFGNSGYHAAKFMNEFFGSKIIAVSDTKGGIRNDKGLDIEKLFDHKMRTGTVTGFEESEAISNEDLLQMNVEVLWPSALEHVITEDNAEKIQAKIIAEAANGPTTPKAQEILHKNGIFVIPDILCNAGGVTVSYFEIIQNKYLYTWDMEKIQKELDEKMTQAFNEVLRMQKKFNVDTHTAAYCVATQRVAKAIKMRGWV